MAASKTDTCNQTAILGLGNLLLKDDGVGIWLIRELQKMGLPAGMDALEIGTAIFSVPSLIRGRTRLIVVDAVWGRGKPGTFYRLTWKKLKKDYFDKKLSLHDYRLQDLLAMPELNRIVLSWELFGIEPAEIVLGYGLSDRLSQLLPLLTNKLYKEL